MSIRFKETFPYRRLAMLVGIFVAIFLSGTAANHALADTSRPVPKDEAQGRVISIYDRGEERTIITKAKTLKQALESAGVEVAIGHDIVEPSLDTELVATKYNVNIYRARPVTVVDGVLRKRVTTAEQTAEGIAKAANIELHKEDETELEATKDLLLDGAGISMSIDRASTILFTLYGKESTVRTQAATIGEFLQEKGIDISESDSLSLPKDTPVSSGMSLKLWRDGVQTLTVDEEVAFKTDKVQDANRESGYREVKQAGVVGKRSVTYEVEMKGGEEISRKEVASIIVEEPKTQVEVIGVKNTAMPYTGGGTKSDWLAASNIPQESWGYADFMVQKESGWNPNALNKSSGACGLAQALPCSKLGPNWSDPVVALNWMNGYVNGRYYDGSPYVKGQCGGIADRWQCAYKFWTVYHWY